MANSSKGPVQIQTPLPVHGLDVPAGVPAGAHVAHGRGVGRRRLLVQTDTGDVLVVEVDRTDGAGKVKRTVQAALNMPMGQAELLCGDQVVDNLTELKHNTPVLLKRGVHRSASSPCLSAMRHLPDHIHHLSSPVDVVGGGLRSAEISGLIRCVVDGLAARHDPLPASGGLGGAYYFCGPNGEKAAILKPTDEEPFAPNNPNGYVGRVIGQPGLKKAIRVGEAGVREVAAYILDHGGFAGVPATTLVRAAHPVFHVAGGGRCGGSASVQFGCAGCSPVPSKICSMQKFVPHDFDASEHGTSRFPVAAVHRIAILDIRLFNTDRHSGNILVRQLSADEAAQRITRPCLRMDDPVDLIPIDHGFCLPEALEAAYFEWLHWPQAALPFSDEELSYISSLDALSEIEELQEKLPMLREGSLRILLLSTMLLQRGAAYGLTLAEIGGIMSREIRGLDEEASELEQLCHSAMRLVRERTGRVWSIKCEEEGGEGEEECKEGEGDEEEEEEEEEEEVQFQFDEEEGFEEDARSSSSAGQSEEAFSDDEVEAGMFYSESRESQLQQQHQPPQQQSFMGRGCCSRRLVFDDLGSPSHASFSSPSGMTKRIPLHESSSSVMRPQAKPRHRGLVPSSRSEEVLASCPPPSAEVIRRRISSTLSWRRFRRFLAPDQSVQQGWGSNSAGTLGAESGGKRGKDDLHGELAVGAGDRAVPAEAFVPGELDEVSWIEFVDVYSSLLEDFLSQFVARRASRLQQFGTSCQF